MTAFAISLFAALGSLALLITAIVVLGRLLAFFSGVLWPLAVAGILALILRPPVKVIERRLRMRRQGAVVLLYGVVVVFAGGVLLLILPPLVTQIIDFFGYLPTLWQNVSRYVTAHYPDWVALLEKYMANPRVAKMVDGIAAESQLLLGQALPTLGAAFGGALDLFGFFTNLAVVPVYLFFFLLMPAQTADDLGQHLTFLRPRIREDVVFLTREFASIIESFFRGQILIGACMGVLLATGFTVIGLEFGLVIGLALGALNIIPYLGTILGLVITMPLAYFQPDGDWRLVGQVLAVQAVVQFIESWVLTPKIMGQSTGLHPMTIMVAIFFWATAFNGLLGMVLAVPLTAFFVTAWRLAKRKYFNPEHA
jgi:predicted PurR-regulated permease PerM